MVELNISKNNNQFSKTYGKYYARVDYKEPYDINKLADHMAGHNTPFSKGAIKGILEDMVACIRELTLSGNTVKIENLAIFKVSAQANPLTLAKGGEIPRAAIGTATDNNTAQNAVRSMKLLAQSTGSYTRAELNKDTVLGWTKMAQKTIKDIVIPETPAPAPAPSGD